MGNLVFDYYEQKEQNELRDKLLSGDYYRYQNDIISKNKALLWKIVKDIPKHPDRAETSLRNLYFKARLESGGKDNFFCYDLADKLVRAAGLEPKIMYEDE